MPPVSSRSSVGCSYDGAVVLLTGSLGFLGSVVLEQVLRLTKVSKVYALVRAKKQLTAQQRLQHLLSSPLFHHLHKQGSSDVFDKVQAIEGDLALPGLGLSPADSIAVSSQVKIILHCAALIELDADVHKTLRNNYLGTKHLMALAANMPHLTSFVFTSTYFVNNFLPHNTIVREQIYGLPLTLDGKPVSAERFAEAMLSLSPAEAHEKTTGLMRQLNFSSTYAFGKWLTECLVSNCSIRPGVKRAIVRPSLIAGIAGDPYPGFVSGYAGAGGYCIAYGLKFFQGPSSVAYRSDTFLDLIPADIVASLVIAAASAGGSACADKCAIYHATSSGSHPMLIGWAFDKMYQFWKQNPPPISLPLTRLVKLGHSAPHPTAEGIAHGHRVAQAKLKLLKLPLRLAGQHRAMHLLCNGFKAFAVQNSLPYAKSLVCSVDNARELQMQLDPADKRVFCLVWEPTVMSWEDWSGTFLAAVRQLLLKQDRPIKGMTHRFVKLPAAGPASLPSLQDHLPQEQAHLLKVQRQWLAISPKSPDSSAGAAHSHSSSEASVEERGALADVICPPAAADQQVIRHQKQVLKASVVRVRVAQPL